MQHTESKSKLVVISAIGSLIENYDFAIYGFFATLLIGLFFPHDSKSMQLILAYVVFTVGYIVRPFGGVVFGHLGDVLGRRAGLVLSMICMGIPLLLISILPTYQTIGMSAAVLLIICRLLQGLSVGGEFPSAITFLAEHASVRRRGVISSLSFLGINAGLLLASGVGALLSHWLTTPALSLFGWRIAFAFGAVLAVLGYFIRRHLAETPVFLAAHEHGTARKLPLLYSLRYESLTILRAACVIAVFAASVPVVLIFMPNYLFTYQHVPMNEAMKMNTLNALIFIIAIPLAGWASDCFGRKPILLIGAAGFLCLSLPLYQLTQSTHLAVIFSGMVGLGLCTACVTGPMVPALAEFFKTTARLTSVALAYNISVALFGGTSLVAITTLIHITHNPLAAAWVMMTIALISILSIITLRFPAKQAL